MQSRRKVMQVVFTRCAGLDVHKKTVSVCITVCEGKHGKQQQTRAFGTFTEAETCPEAQRLMTHPGVGALTAIAFVLIIGKADRFGCGKQIASYLGLVPEEDSSGERRRLGHISKQGNSLLRFLLVEAAQVTVRSDTRWRNRFFHLAQRGVQRPNRSAGANALSASRVAEADQGRGYADRADLPADAGRSASLWQEPRRGWLSGPATGTQEVRRERTAAAHQ